MRESGIRRLVTLLDGGELSCEEMIAERMAVATSAEASGVFTVLNESILEQAKEVDRARSTGEASALAGVPLTLKDLYNVRGQATLAGSKVLADTAEIEQNDAEVVKPLRDAGMLFFGRTNMSEFAFSGMGLNPHYPALYSTWDRSTGRLPGGSSSGSAVSVALGIVPATLGSDTAGSCRIPAAFNGIVGVKPSYGRLSLSGIYPLSPTSDAPGPLALDVDSCFILDHLMSGQYTGQLPNLDAAMLRGMRLLIPEGIVIEDLDPEVALTFERAVSRLEAAGVEVLIESLSVVDDCVEMFLKRPIAVYEAWIDHQEMLENSGEEYDPYVFQRMRNGSHVTEEMQTLRYQEKRALIECFEQDFALAGIDGLIYPTVPCVPPPVSATEGGIEEAGVVNLRCLRNTGSVNYFDGCAVSLPCHDQDEAPVGLMLCCPGGSDERLYQLAAAIEPVVSGI